MSGRYSGQAAIVVVLPGRDLPTRDQYVSGRYSGRPGRGLGLSAGDIMYHAAIVENWLLGLVLRRWPGITACQADIVAALPGRGSTHRGSVCNRPL